ncbi:MAG: ATP-binding protein [Maricaulaceae bacterium]
MNVDDNIIQIIVLAGSVLLAVVSFIFALRAHSQGERNDGWKERCSELDQKLASIDSVFGSYPGLIMVWDEVVPDPALGWGEPRMYGSPAALASVGRFADQGGSKSFTTRILDGLADLDTIGEEDMSLTLRANLAALRKSGTPFSVSVVLPGGNVIEADGRPAGRQVVLWLEDASIRGEDERTAINRFETHRETAAEDPVAFVEMMSRAPFPLWRISGTGRLTWVNEAYAKAVGCEDFGPVIADQIFLDAAAAEQAKTALRSGVRVEDNRPIVIDGDRKSMNITVFPVSGGAAGIAMDASEADQLRGALKRHVQSHDELLNTMDEAIVIFSADKRMSFHNNAFANMFKLGADWFSGRPGHSEWLDHVREKSLLPEQADFAEWKSHELSLYTDWPDEMPPELWALPDGTTLRLARLRDPSGGISLLFSDMTQTITLQSQLGTLNKVQKTTLDKLSEGIAVFGTDGRMKISNSAFAKLWNLNADKLNEGPRFSAVAEACLPLYHDRAFWAEMQARATDPNPDVRRHVDGEIQRADDKVLTWLSRPLPDGATLIAWDDVTRARQAEDALIERAEALEQADRLKSEFVGHVSYQLRTPLTTISGYADLLQSNAAGELNDKQSEYVFAVQSASEDLAKTIDDILDIAAIEANVLDLELGDVDIYGLLYNSLDYVATKAEDTKIGLTLECPEDIGVIRADETRIKQIVYNLMSNALRFTKPGGKIVLSASRAEGGVTLSVKDDGVGIPSERQPQVFESFKSSRGGTGLGLALVQRFVEAHGGWVELESEEGEGTLVSCYLPLEAVVDSAHPELDL